ncbi:hypothetical protein P3S67_001077 [Capsicum chacoense]
MFTTFWITCSVCSVSVEVSPMSKVGLISFLADIFTKSLTDPCISYIHNKLAVIDSILGYLNITCDPATFIQGAIPQILQKTKDDFFSKIVNMLREDADICYGRIKDIPCITSPIKPEGSIFVMVKLHLNLLEDIEDDLEFYFKLDKEESLMILPDRNHLKGK